MATHGVDRRSAVARNFGWRRMRLEPVQRVLQSLHAPHALIGAHALAARSFPRFTIDIAILTSDPRVLDTGIWSVLQQEGATAAI